MPCASSSDLSHRYFPILCPSQSQYLQLTLHITSLGILMIYGKPERHIIFVRTSKISVSSVTHVRDCFPSKALPASCTPRLRMEICTEIASEARSSQEGFEVRVRNEERARGELKVEVTIQNDISRDQLQKGLQKKGRYSEA